MGWAEWPARLQQLGPARCVDLLPAGSELWLDGGHNPAAARAVADHFRGSAGRPPFHIVFGLLANKDAPGVLNPFAAAPRPSTRCRCRPRASPAGRARGDRPRDRDRAR
jgi:folylpolyglutamate synthase/dihydropteroate synthase